MSDISRAVLFGKLNCTLYKALENAYSFSHLRENSYVELVHWLHTLLQTENTDIFAIIKRFDIDENLLRKDVLLSIEELPIGSTSISDFSEHIQSLVEHSWIYCSLKFGNSNIRTAHLIYSLLKVPSLTSITNKISNEFLKIKPDSLADEFLNIVKNSAENSEELTDQIAQHHSKSNHQSALELYGINLTEKARNGKIDAIVGRDSEIRQIIDILMRRRQNNPILTGEAGVGKTAVVEALALKIIAGEVPPALKNVQLYLLDIGLLKAGASLSGEFEARLKSIMREIEISSEPIVLFIDEIHTLIGAGGSAGTGDAANLLKPALARGSLRTIGATTWAEYKKYFEKDPALTRRFQVIQINEPDEKLAINMLRALAFSLEKHHQVVILEEAIQASVKLSHRYIPARQLPDKAVGLLDTACARVAISQHTMPGTIDFLKKSIIALELEQTALERENKFNLEADERLFEIKEQLGNTNANLTILEAKWQEESKIVSELVSIRHKIINLDTLLDQSNNELFDTQRILLENLKQIQGSAPLVLPLVDAHAIANVIADWTGIPIGKMMKDELQAILSLADTLNERVIGQKHGLEAIAKRIQTSRATLDDPNKPIGVFMLAGPSGVGKTETALALADSIYGGEHNVITINMSEYQEAHSVSTLKGSPPGYIGYGEGGVLTEAVRRRPYSIVLLDEVEKAHPDVHEIFFQVFDKGWMEDGEGRYIDFKNTIIILTTNVGSELILNLCEEPDLTPTPEGLKKSLREPLLQIFPAALLGRMQIIPYYPLTDEMLSKIVALQLSRIAKRVNTNHNIQLTYDQNILQLITSRCTEIESGGRMIDSILTNIILPEISTTLLQQTIKNQFIKSIHLSVENEEFKYSYN